MRKTPLFGEYESHGAKVVDFHGWALPVQFSGILEEHQHTRTHAGIFDCSHMCEFLVSGRPAIAALDFLCYSDFAGLKPGRCRYGALLNERGGVVDDCVGLRLSDDLLYLVTNAGPVQQVEALFARHGVVARNISDETAKIDLQGPRSREILLEIGLDAVAPLKYWTGVRTTWRDREVLITRGGYTGELGYEIFVSSTVAPELWRVLAWHPEVRVCGLGARDTLRLEMGYPLYGEDADENTSPLECGMDRFINWDKDFLAKKEIAAQRERGDYARLTGIRSLDRRAPRHGFELKQDGQVIGTVTSGTFGPSVGCGIGLARVKPPCDAPGTALAAGPREMAVETVEMPVYQGGTCRVKI